MPIIPIPYKKVAILNDQKNRGLLVEFPADMGLDELLVHIDEFRLDILRKMEENLEKAKVNSPEEQSQKTCVKETIVQNIGD